MLIPDGLLTVAESLHLNSDGYCPTKSVGQEMEEIFTMLSLKMLSTQKLFVHSSLLTA
jgi:hypothetical protein